MSIEKTDFESIAESDLQELVDAQVPEGLRLEFKLTNYGNSDSDKRELLKDVSAFANSHGGHLVLGVEEVEGVAAKVDGVAIDSDGEILRMEQITRNAIEPPISGVRMRAIPLSNGNKAFLLRIPRSWNPPHRVTAQGINRFFLRHSAGVHEPSVEELRSLFNQSATALEKARQFRNDRITIVSNGEGHRPLVGEGRLLIHIVPTAAFTGMINIDVEKVHEKHRSFWPLGATSLTPRFNFHGFINERGGNLNYGYTQIFRNGSLEATKANILQKCEHRLVIPGISLEKHIFEMLSTYIDGLRAIGVPPPLVIMFSMEGVKDAYYVVDSYPSDEEIPLPNDVLLLPECVLEDYGDMLHYHQAVRPAFDALWNALGYSKSKSFDRSGLWKGYQGSF